MNDRSDFQQLVDRSLSPLQWNERRKRQVLRAIAHQDERRLPFMRGKLAVALAITLCLVLMTSAAVATYTITYNPKAHASKLATQAMKQRYGLTDAALGLFWNPVMEENGVFTVTYTNDLLVPDDLTGIYTVTVEGKRVSITWTHDNADSDTYASGKLSCPIWGAPQLNYLASLSSTELEAQTKPYRNEKRKYGTGPAMRIDVLTPEKGEMDEAEAIALALDALHDVYGLNADEVPTGGISTLMTDFSLPQRSWYVWVNAPSGEGTYSVILDAMTREVYSIHMNMPTPR